MWIHVYRNGEMNFNSKNGRKKAYLMKPKHQYHIPQWEECVYGPQSWKEKRLLFESIFNLIKKWTSILKMVEREVFLMKPKHLNHLSQQGESVYSAQSCKERRLLC